MNTILFSSAVLVALCLIPAAIADDVKRGDVVFKTDFEAKDALKDWATIGEGKVQLVPGRGGSQSLMVDRPADLKAGGIFARIALPVEKLRGARVDFEALVKAQDVAKPPQPWNGVKFMLHTVSPSGKRWEQHNNVFGTFDWQKVRFVGAVPRDANEAWLYLGLEATTGAAWFDDVKVSIAMAPRPRPAKPAAAATQPAYKGHDLPRLRGTMINNVPKEEDLRELGTKWNANVVRWQLHRPEVNYGDADGRDMKAFDEWLDQSLKRLDQLLPVCEQAGLMVVVDLHTPPGGHDKSNNHLLFQEAAFQRKFLEVWDKIASRCKDRKAVWGYDLLNEPVQGVVAEGLMDWQELATAAAKRVRAIDANHAIIVEPEPWGSPESLEFLHPIPVGGVVYSVHMYQPHQFTHQGVFGLPVGLKYPGEIGGKKWDKDALRAALKPVVDFQRDYNVHVFIGEFSAIRWAPENGAFNYLRDLTDIFEENGWDWTYHAFREWDGWSVEHGDDPKDRSPSKTQTDREKLLRSWFAKNRKP